MNRVVTSQVRSFFVVNTRLGAICEFLVFDGSR